MRVPEVRPAGGSFAGRAALALVATPITVALACSASTPQVANASAGSETASSSSAQSPAASSSESPTGDESGGSRLELPKTVFLSVLPVTVHPRAYELTSAAADDVAFARGLRVRLEIMRAYKDAGELTRRSRVNLINGTFQLTDLSHLQSRDPVVPAYSKSSFVVDFDQASFNAPVEQAKRAGDLSAQGLTAFVGKYIEHKSYAHGFDVASRVANTRSGDCSEHAVFTTALLRRFGIAARVVFGIVLVGVNEPGSEPELSAVGHAWAESFENGHWQIADAALQPEGPAVRHGIPGLPPNAQLHLAYLPIVVLKDESVSYARALMDEVGVESVVRVDVDAVTGTHSDP
ncbi:MAG TPA: transglutaminase-like domain-containing protein [Polyangiaceae bacterium]|nr:transglutaminase-like domain-containing protein [Polyangiaceae bacterium]